MSLYLIKDTFGIWSPSFLLYVHVEPWVQPNIQLEICIKYFAVEQDLKKNDLIWFYLCKIS